MATQEIYVLNKRLKLLHSEKGFKTSMDSVLLAAACPVTAGEHILDLGCGVGGAGLCVLARMKGAYLTGVEIQKEHVELAERNAEVNLFQDQTTFLYADIKEYREEKAFDHVIINPPYLEAGAHLRSPSQEKAVAMGHSKKSPCPQAGGRDSKSDSIKDWIDCAHFCLKSKGSLTIIHRADQVDQIIRALGKRFGRIEIFPLWPKEGVNAKRVIIRCYKDRYSPTTMYAGLVLHDASGEYTAEANQVLRDAQVLF